MQELLEKTAAPQKTGDKNKVLRVCFVCTGNTCRSPMAEAITNALAKEKGAQIEAFSAGLSAMVGEPIAKNALLALEEARIPEVHPYHLHLSHTITEQEAKSYDLLIGLTERHAMELFFRFPTCLQKIKALPHDVADPFGGDLATYRSCLEQIKKEVSEFLFPEVAK